MRRSSSILLACAALAACSGTPRPRVPPPRELGRATIDGVEIRVGVAGVTNRVEGRMTRQLGYAPQYDLFAVVDQVSATKDGARVPLYEIGVVDPAFAGEAPRNARELASRVRAVQAETCGVEHGLVVRLGRRWEVVWIVGERGFRVPIHDATGTCREVAARLSPRDTALAENPGGATTCLALAEASRADAALDCFLAGVENDLLPSLPAPEPGRVEARVLTHRDRDAVERRIVEDPTMRERFETRLVDAPPEYTSLDQVVPIVRTLEAAGRIEPFVHRVIASCRSPEHACSSASLWVAQTALQGRADECALVSELVAAVRARGEPDATVRAFRAARGAFDCDSAELRALYLAGLVVMTTPDTRLPSPDYVAYSGIDPDCQESAAGSRPDILASCSTLARFAGTWLSVHCSDDAVQRATALARSRPRTPFDPREDQLLDGALRVLGRCDGALFEATIAHVPDTVATAADLRSKEHLRAVFLHASTATP